MLSDEDKQWFSTMMDRVFEEREERVAPLARVEPHVSPIKEQVDGFGSWTLWRLDLFEKRLLDGFRNAAAVFEAHLDEQELRAQAIKSQLEFLNDRVKKLEDERRAS